MSDWGNFEKHNCFEGQLPLKSLTFDTGVVSLQIWGQLLGARVHLVEHLPSYVDRTLAPARTLVVKVRQYILLTLQFIGSADTLARMHAPILGHLHQNYLPFLALCLEGVPLAVLPVF